ncbi:MAG: hypothetical protein ABI690_19755 [Chloroflexota bacterium]
MSILEKQVQTVQDTSCEKTDCCSTAEDGSAVCMVPQTATPVNAQAESCGCNSDASSCGCNSVATVQTPSIQVVGLSSAQPKRTLSDHLAECSSTWQKIRSGVMFVVACIASPCCTPLIVPAALALLAGTPVAVWMGQNLGWVYGGLTLLSGIGFVLALRWMGKNGGRRAGLSAIPSANDRTSKNKTSSQSV